MKRDDAFIKFSDPRDADEAQYNLDGKDVDGSHIIVEFARGVCFLEEQEAASPIADPDPAPRADVDEAMALVSSRPSLPEPVRQVLSDIRRRLESSSLKALVTNTGPIQGRYEEISSLVPDELAEALQLVAHIDFHRFGVMKALKRIADRAACDELKACIVSAKRHIQEELEKLNEVKGRPAQIQTRLEQLRKERANLQAVLEAKDTEIQEEEASLAGTDQVLKQQEAAWRSAMDRVLAYYNALSSAEIPGSDKDDNEFLAGLDLIRLSAIDASEPYL